MQAGIARRGLVAVGLALTIACGRENPDTHFKKANDYLKESHVDDAIIEYRLALNADPKRGDIRTKLAEAYMEKRDFGNAYREYIRAADLLPNDAAVQVKAGSMLLLASKFEDAKTRAKQALAIDPQNLDAQILLGNADAGMKNFDDALADYNQATTLNPTDDRAYASTGVLQYTRGNNTEAEASFRKAVDVAPKSVAARLALANFLWAMRRVPEAEAAFKAALDIDPKNLAANRMLGFFYFASNRRAEAEPYFKTVSEESKTTDDSIALADYYVAVDRKDDARKVLTELAKTDKGFAIATTRLAALDAMAGDHAKAHTTLRQVIDKYPKDMGARLLDARVYAIDGKRDQALTSAQSIVTEEPNAPESAATYMLIGSLQASLGRQEDATKAYEEVLKRQGQPVPAQLALAALHLRSREFDKALSYVQQAQVSQPNNPLARTLMVRILLAQGKQPEAKAQLAALQKDYPGSPEVLKLVAAQQALNHDYDGARATYGKALQAAPSDIEAATGLVGVDLAAGRKNDALARVDAGLKAAPTSADMLILAARTYASVRDTAKAEDYLTKAIQADPTRLEAYGMLGQLYAMDGQLAGATEQFQKLLERDPNSVPITTLVGMLLEAQHKQPDAEKYYQKALALDPHAGVAANNLAWMYVAGNRNLDQALQLAQTAVQQMPDDPHVADTLGWIYYQKGQAQQAVTYLEMSVKKNAADPTGLYHLGMAYVRVGDLEKGRAALKQAVNSKIEFEGINEARKTLAQLGG